MTRAAGEVPSPGPKDETLPVTGDQFCHMTKAGVQESCRVSPEPRGRGGWAGHSHPVEGPPPPTLCTTEKAGT